MYSILSSLKKVGYTNNIYIRLHTVVSVSGLGLGRSGFKFPSGHKANWVPLGQSLPLRLSYLTGKLWGVNEEGEENCASQLELLGGKHGILMPPPQKKEGERERERTTA